jgi:hypothetical protein
MAWKALAIFEELHAPDVDQVCTLLASQSPGRQCLRNSLLEDGHRERNSAVIRAVSADGRLDSKLVPLSIHGL